LPFQGARQQQKELELLHIALLRLRHQGLHTSGILMTSSASSEYNQKEWSTCRRAIMLYNKMLILIGMMKALNPVAVQNIQ